MSQLITENNAHYSVGIDLGTTHCVLSYVDLTSDEEQLIHQVLAVPQLSTPGSVEEKSQLPSFIYQAHEAELAEGDIALPWQTKPSLIVGAMARHLGSKTPLRLIASAKSWLCHSGVDRHSDFLPFNSPDEVSKLSPVAAACAYLEHLKAAWDHRFPQDLLAQQDVTITVPASFDPAARELTAQAATDVGFTQVTLLEEPQAALYSWIHNHDQAWRDQVSVGDVILVVDIGGGTTDLSLVAVTEEEGNLSLNRVAVGDHILLGGDNMDLALAYRLKAKLAQQGKNLQPWQIQGITQACRNAKEALLNDPDLAEVAIVVPSRGSKLMAGTLQTELTQEEVQQTLVEGFFPVTDISEHPVEQQRGALTQMGLPYAQDAAISRHLAGFLSRQQAAVAELFGTEADEFIKPTAVLFNGGVLKSPLLSERLFANINRWLTTADAAEAKLLTGLDLDLAVASGAAYYGYVRQGKGVRIRGGIASAYYVGIESAMPAIPGMEPPIEALCVAPFGMEEGAQLEVPGREFGLVVGQPVQFKFFGSTVRRDDQPGILLDYWEPEELEQLPAIEVNLPLAGRSAGEVVPVRLAARVTEVGTLALEAIPRDGAERWQVEFEVRSK
ncbi:MAG: Hsp70 family protein [Bermanella sp.]